MNRGATHHAWARARTCRRGSTTPNCHTSHLLVSLLVLLTLMACRADEHSARGVADRFVDQHYVEINLEAAKSFCSGLALKKMEDEQRLTAGQTIDESTRKPSIHYRLIDKKEDADKFTRKWIITTRRNGERWTVSNFEEFD
jgi:hypothetical protein